MPQLTYDLESDLVYREGDITGMEMSQFQTSAFRIKKITYTQALINLQNRIT